MRARAVIPIGPRRLTWWLAWWLLAAGPASGAVWQRHIESGKGESFDFPRPHRLSYFTRDPYQRDDGNDFCDDCSAKGKAAVRTHHRFKTELRRVGSLSGFAIYDLFYRFDHHIESGEIDWKSILVEVSPGQFREIYHLQPTTAKIGPSFLLKAGGKEILGTRDLIPGTGAYAYEDYFWFSAGGATRIDLKPVNQAVEQVLPIGSGVWKGGGLDMRALRYRMPVWKSGDANCCPSGGTVEVTFKLERGEVVVTGKHYGAPCSGNP
jgi:hypothetical protein